MADEIDLANRQAERWLAQSLASRRAAPSLPPKGCCHYCEAAFPAGTENSDKKLFCDSECAKDYEEEQRLKARR